MLVRRRGDESSMDAQHSSISNRPAEVRIHVSQGTPRCSTSAEVCQNRGRLNSFEEFKMIMNQQETKVSLEVKVDGNYQDLFDAAVRGNWKAADKVLNEDREAMTAEVMTVEKKSITVLEVAVMAAQDQFVERLVKRLPKDYEVKSALDNAARRGRIRMVKALMSKFNAVPENALLLAISEAPKQKEVISYLAKRTTSTPSFNTMSQLILAGHLDICLYLAHRYTSLVTSTDNEMGRLLRILAKMKANFFSGARLNFWEKCIYRCIPSCLVNTSISNSKDTRMARVLMWFKILLWNVAAKPAPFIKRIGEMKLRHVCSFDFARLAVPAKKTRMKSPQTLQFISDVVLDAASEGISEIVILCLRKFPELIWDKDFTEELIKRVVKERHVELFRLVNGHLTDGVVTKLGLMEHVIEWPPGCESPDVYGVAFLLQRELQWFKVVERMSAPSLKSLDLEENESTKEKKKYWEEKKKCWEVFVENRKDLLREAGQWMKDTSSSCSLVATLIITVAFAAAFTVPGGNNSSTGIPIFLEKVSFMVFAVGDALALFFSVTATLMFLAILNSRYAIEDFRHSLPRKMILGLTFLFLSLAFMLVAFSSALTIVLSERLKWIHIPITLLATIPVVLFAILQLPLYFEMVQSTGWPPLYRPLKLWNNLCYYKE